jgi:hypothetical protein
MCTYQHFELPVAGSAKGPRGWFRATRASVYFDHPVHAQAEHTLNVDLLAGDGDPAQRVAVELTAAAARRLAETILAALDEVPADQLGGPELPAGAVAATVPAVAA